MTCAPVGGAADELHAPHLSSAQVAYHDAPYASDRAPTTHEQESASVAAPDASVVPADVRGDRTPRLAALPPLERRRVQLSHKRSTWLLHAGGTPGTGCCAS